MKDKKFYLSIVLATRPDVYHSHSLHRLRLYLEHIYTLATQYNVSTEVVIVETQHLDHQRSLYEVLPLPSCAIPVQLKVICVPYSIYQSYAHREQLTLYPIMTQNVGIRRAAAHFILCTHVDVLLSDTFFSFIAKHKLEPGHVYRCHQYDIQPIFEDPSVYISPAQILSHCKKYTKVKTGKFSKHVWKTTLYMRPIARLVSRVLDVLLTQSLRKYYALTMDTCSSFMLMHRKDWAKIGGYAELYTDMSNIDKLALGAAVALGVKQVRLPSHCCVYRFSYSSDQKIQTSQAHTACHTSAHTLDRITLREIILYMLKHKEVVPLSTPDWGYHGKRFETHLFYKKRWQCYTDKITVAKV